ncbi:hypothetical protein [Noviherbaspirillum galbum]|uniref:Uncharacterized protein n=1 Tax=Noviherbaspirillum galbum TaxID=2709383 RepID=A0A6B3SPN4_9BURK|nr:hypothetical protein [Noviherbaspirillum galbum]NEX62713.1 hypothetical protein [Noviherbaspirillum galbum]
MRNYLLSVLLMTAATLMLLAGVNYAVDPLNRIRPNTSGVYLKAQEREMNPGVARSMKYDTVVIGSSMMENLDPAYIEKLSGWKAINLAVEGSTAYEQRRNLEVALRTGQVKRVIWGVDWGSFSHGPFESAPGPGVPDYLYRDDSALDYVKYVFNVSVLRASFKRLAGVGLVPESELGRVHNWSNTYDYGCSQIAVEEARFKRVGSIFKNHKIGTYRQSVDMNFFALVDEYPKVEFYAMLPPYSAQWVRSLSNYNPFALNDFLGFRKYLASWKRPNLRLFDFMADESIVTNGHNYRDLAHFHESVNQLMFRRALAGEHLPVVDHVNSYIDKPMKCN